ncbi:MAG: PQQ-binding-like beta-propeller repeat protein [Alphaproteobacteria bacterium]
MAQRILGRRFYGYPNHAMEIWSCRTPPQMLLKASIGKGSTKELPLTAQPVLVDGTIYTLDSQGRLSAFDTETGRHLWSGNISDPDEDDPVIGGGLAFSAGILYATNGFDEVLAINPLGWGILSGGRHFGAGPRGPYDRR